MRWAFLVRFSPARIAHFADAFLRKCARHSVNSVSATLDADNHELQLVSCKRGLDSVLGWDLRRFLIPDEE